jgi:hypothetical protein
MRDMVKDESSITLPGVIAATASVSERLARETV